MTIMRYSVTHFRSLAVALKELEPFIRDGEHLCTGKPLKKFGGMRSREILANWLLCVAINFADDRDLTFSSDPIGGDGIISDLGNGETWPIEHVMVPRLRLGQMADAEVLILGAIDKKCQKGGAAYAVGKTLIVFLEGMGVWFPNRVAQKMPRPLHFAAAWIVSLQAIDEGKYIYNVVSLDSSDDNIPIFRVQIGRNFDTWLVDRL